MKTSKTSTAAAIISFTLVGATSAFALSTGAITGNSTPDPTPAATPAAVEVVDAPVVVAPAVATPAVATPAPAVVDQVDAVAAATVPASSTDSVMSSTPDKSADMGPEAVESSNERADKGEKAEKSDDSSDRDSRDNERGDKADMADSSSDRDSRDSERADKADTGRPGRDGRHRTGHQHHRLTLPSEHGRVPSRRATICGDTLKGVATCASSSGSRC